MRGQCDQAAAERSDESPPVHIVLEDGSQIPIESSSIDSHVNQIATALANALALRIHHRNAAAVQQGLAADRGKAR